MSIAAHMHTYRHTHAESFHADLLAAYCVPSTMLGTENLAVNKTDILLGGYKINKQQKIIGGTNAVKKINQG